MNSYFPLVSVIVPAYNAEAFIAHTLNSVLAQTYKNIEVLVVDDGSQDRTRELVESIAQNDYRVILLQQSNAGVAAARNLAIQKSSGEYIAPIDADDIWYPQKLEKQVQCMLQADPSVGLVYARSVHINENGEILWNSNGFNVDYVNCLEGEVYTALIYRNFIGNASVPLIRRACFEKVGDYNCQLKEQKAQGCEDWELYLRIAEFYQFRVVPEFLVGYRQVTGSMASNCMSMEKSYHLVIADVKQRHPKIPNTIYQWSSSLFYEYLIEKSRSIGDYWSIVRCLYKALKVDYIFLLRLGLYKLFIMCILKIAVKPVTSLIWSDHRSWLQFKQKVSSANPVITINDINKEINQPQQLSWKPYDRIMLHRWYQVVQLCYRDKEKMFEDSLAASFQRKITP